MVFAPKMRFMAENEEAAARANARARAEIAKIKDNAALQSKSGAKGEDEEEETKPGKGGVSPGTINAITGAIGKAMSMMKR